MTESPRAGIVTRTKNRPVLLKRAIESILFQTYRNWVMVIVNDGGDPAPIDALVAHYAVEAAGRIRVVHNPRSLGMEGASAAGIAAVESELLVVHDDDDSWSPEFLTVAIAELDRLQRDYPTVQGVTTYCNRVMEHVQGQLIHIDSVEPFNSWVPPGFLSLDRMLAANFLPPISFLFTREAFDALGRVCEAIPYLGDWDFLVRFLSKYEVFMVPQYLAFYHWRTGPDSAWLGTRGQAGSTGINSTASCCSTSGCARISRPADSASASMRICAATSRRSCTKARRSSLVPRRQPHRRPQPP